MFSPLSPLLLKATHVRIDFVITELWVGGAERCLTEIAIGLAESGDRVRVFSIWPLPSGEQSALVDRLREAGIEVVSGEARSVFALFQVRRKLKEFFEQSPPDLCQSFLFHANAIASPVARQCGVPTVIGGLRVAESRPLRCLIESRAIRKMDGLICVSEAVKEFSIDRLAANPMKTSVIPNSVDVTRFATGESFQVPALGWPSDSQVVLFVGRLHPQKGLDLIQKQIDRIAPVGSHRKLILVGDGPLADSIDTWCQSVGNDRVQRLPWQSDVAPLVRRCDLLLLPSRYEGMPNVVLEAMAAARPIVCSRVEGIAELLGNDDEQTFDIDDDRTMADRIDGLLAKPSRAIEIGEANQNRVRQNFSIPTMVDAYRSYYREAFTRRLDAE